MTTKAQQTQIDPDVQSWIDTYYLDLKPQAVFDLVRFLHPELNIQEWSGRHYIKLPMDAEQALASMLARRTGSVAATLTSIGEGTSLPELESSLECKCSSCDQKFLVLRQRIAELQTKNEQLWAAYVSAACVVVPTEQSPCLEPVGTDLPAAQEPSSEASVQVHVCVSDTTTTPQLPRLNKNQQKFRMKNNR